MADETHDTMQEATPEDTQAGGAMAPSEGVVPARPFDTLQQTDLLGMVVQKKGEYHSNDDYVALIKLASLNRGWRKAVENNIREGLSAKAGMFKLEIDALHAGGDLPAIVRGVLDFKYAKYEALHLHAITALHVAVSTGHFMAQARALKSTADAGGLEAVLSVLFMCRHSSNMALSIVCVRMLNLYAAYNKRDGCRWGLWTERHLNMGLECITGAMRNFRDNLDLQCCAISCLATLCLQDDIPQDAHMHICQAHVASQGVLPLLMIAMHTHDNAGMYVDVCKLLFMYNGHRVSQQPPPAASCEVVALQALRHSLTLGHKECIYFLTKLLCQLCEQEQWIHHELISNPAVIPLCLQILQEVRGNVETDTPEQAVQQQTIREMVSTLLCDVTEGYKYMASTVLINLTEYHNPRRFFQQDAGAVALVVQAITDSREFIVLQPAALFQCQPCIFRRLCLMVQTNLSEVLSRMELDPPTFLTVQWPPAQQLLDVIRETDDDGERLKALTALHVASSTGHFMAQTRALKTTADAGGLEAVLGALFMARGGTNVALCIACVRMLRLYFGYNKPGACSWGACTDKQTTTGLVYIHGAMLDYADNIDLQCCAISCLATLCLQDGTARTAQMDLCKQYLRDKYVLRLLMIAMHTHENTGMYVDVCKLLAMYDCHRQSAPGAPCEVVALQALRHSYALGHIESICFLMKFLSEICRLEQQIQHNLWNDPTVIPFCLQILQAVRPNVETDTPEQAVQKQTANVIATRLLKYITQAPNPEIIFLQNAGSIALVMQAITYSHELSILQPAALFQQEPFITRQMCDTVQHNLCEMLSQMVLEGSISPIMQCGAMQQLVNVIRETESDGVRLVACHVAKNIAEDDNGERLMFLKAGGLQVFVNQILPLPFSHDNRDCKKWCVMCLASLAQFPVYATAMFELGFLDLAIPPSPHKDALIPLLQRAEDNPVYPP